MTDLYVIIIFLINLAHLNQLAIWKALHAQISGFKSSNINNHIV